MHLMGTLLICKVTCCRQLPSCDLQLTLVHVLGDLWLLVLAVLHHVVDMAEDGVDRVLILDIEGEEGDNVLVLDKADDSAVEVVELFVGLGIHVLEEQVGVWVEVSPDFAADPALLVLYEIHLAHEAEHRDAEGQHAAHSGQDTGKVLCLVLHKLRFDEVHCRRAEVEPCLEELGELREQRNVRVQLNLARAVDDEVLVLVVAQLLLEPVEVVEEVP